jgi:choline-sulfatase
MKNLPNILFLMSDEHRPDVTGYEGNTIIRTPVLDELARTGVQFRNAYTPSPICIPSRQCMAVGQLPRTCGCLRYGQDLPPFSMTFARLLSENGYMTVAAGKLHHTGQDQMQGWRMRIGLDTRVESYNSPPSGAEPKGANKPNPYKWSDVKEIQRAGIGDGPGAVKDSFALRGLELFIREHFNSPYYDRGVGSPVMLMLSLNKPHYPYLTTEERFNYYLNRVEPYVGQTVFEHPFLSRRQVKPGIDVSERELRRTTAAYYGMIETIDSEYGRVMDALTEVGQNLDDWIIIYTSDHGEMLGEHGIWEKQKFFEASVRVPLIIRYPQKFESRIVHENVNLCDLYATLCDLTGNPVPEGLDSRSLTDLMNGSDSRWRNETVSHFGGTNLMIKHDHLKYQYYGEEAPEVLFDLKEDPQETVNFIGSARHEQEISAFRKRRAELGYGPDANPSYKNAGYSH